MSHMNKVDFWSTFSSVLNFGILVEASKAPLNIAQIPLTQRQEEDYCENKTYVISKILKMSNCY